MTRDEIATEKAYLIQERLGICCGARTPTAGEIALAEKEAREWEERVTKASPPAL